jgi:membrane-anchored protein YejM (alkaline phosphatase superfamily)
VIPGVDLLSRKYHWTNEGFNRTLSVQLHEINRHLTDNATTLTFIHLNVPHLPGARTDGLTMTRELKALSGYEQNLFTVDRIVGDVVNSLEAQSKLQDILLIISSDHWLRTKYNTKNLSPDQVEMEFGFDTSEVHKIPLLIRRMRETSQFIIPQPINTIHTANLIDDFLAGKVSNHASIATWWLSKPYSPPIIGAERE